eukprot:jgi/Botrbrau1/21781/Bobra.0190s0008.1
MNSAVYLTQISRYLTPCRSQRIWDSCWKTLDSWGSNGRRHQRCSPAGILNLFKSDSLWVHQTFFQSPHGFGKLLHGPHEAAILPNGLLRRWQLHQTCRYGSHQGNGHCEVSLTDGAAVAGQPYDRSPDAYTFDEVEEQEGGTGNPRGPEEGSGSSVKINSQADSVDFSTNAAEALYEVEEPTSTLPHEQSQEVNPLSETLGEDNFPSFPEQNFVSVGRKQKASVPLERQRVLTTAILGVPNAGKSTLINALIRSKVAAVSPKTNTTVIPILGAFVKGDAQVVMYDTPGVVVPSSVKNASQQERVKSAWAVAGQADLLMLVVDGMRQIEAPDPRVASLVASIGQQLDPCPPSLLLLNKVDKLSPFQRRQLQELAFEFSELHDFAAVFNISARGGAGLPQLRDYLALRAAAGPWLLDEGETTDLTPQALAEEVVREKVFCRMYSNVPYDVKFELQEWTEKADGSLVIRFDLKAPSEGVRRMLIGKKGSVVGLVGKSARLELQSMFKRDVHLFIDVKR